MLHTQAKCGHSIVALGSPNSLTRIRTENSNCFDCGGSTETVRVELHLTRDEFLVLNKIIELGASQIPSDNLGKLNKDWMERMVRYTTTKIGVESI